MSYSSVAILWTFRRTALMTWSESKKINDKQTKKNVKEKKNPLWTFIRGKVKEKHSYEELVINIPHQVCRRSLNHLQLRTSVGWRPSIFQTCLRMDRNLRRIVSWWLIVFYSLLQKVGWTTVGVHEQAAHKLWSEHMGEFSLSCRPQGSSEARSSVFDLDQSW